MCTGPSFSVCSSRTPGCLLLRETLSASVSHEHKESHYLGNIIAMCKTLIILPLLIYSILVLLPG